MYFQLLKKKKAILPSPDATPAAPSEPSPLPDFTNIASRVFTVQGTTVYIGGQKVTPQVRGVLRDQARSFQTSQLWEIIDATITNEASQLALIQSQNFEQVQFAKALYHWCHTMKNVIHTLAKD